ncbi:hypothetical protein [Maridesulfovibrio ferrireducens]|uniref:hypothetical protein n=1 Tax=Maridesulfovibrio ferrireducens TaxID=246191 RepID=UPI001A271F87|nr:hypothetical protein [Maridesulfovibrio ferrireducens]MBI9109983.1 hypothetical protein [Maridesulfovibrio ferrireducens]
MIFPNAHQIYLYLSGQHESEQPVAIYKLSKNTVGNHIKDGKLSPGRSGFSKRTVDAYARNHLILKDAPKAVKVVKVDPGDFDGEGAQSRRVNADADLKTIEARRKRHLFARELGKYISILNLEAELAARWQSVSLLLNNFAHEVGPDVAHLFGGGEKQAVELVEACGGDPDLAENVSRILFSRVPEFTAMFRKRTREVLSSLGSGEWYTEEMRLAFEKWERNRAETSKAEALAAIQLVGGNPDQLDVFLEYFEVTERGENDN